MPPASFLASKMFSIFCVSKTAWSAVDFSGRNPACSLGGCGSIIGSTQVWISLSRIWYLAPINSHLNVVVRSTTPFGLSQNGCGPFRGSQLSWALSSDSCITPLFNPTPFVNATFPPHPRLQILYPPSYHFVSSPSAPSPLPLDPGCPSTLPASSSF